MQAKPIREGAPATGYSRVAIGNGHIVVGEGDGSLKCFTVANFSKNLAPLWSFNNAHGGQVTAVTISKALDAAFSCGRDGKVLMVTNISSPTPSAPMAILTVSGELNSLALTPDARRLFVAGDSVRCFTLDTQKIHTVHMTVPYPIVNIAVTSDGHYVAMASACGSLGVVSFQVDNKLGGSTDAPPLFIRSLVPRIMPIAHGGGSADVSATRLAWVHNPHKNTNTLYVPTPSGVQLHALVEDMAANVGGGSSSIGGGGEDKPKGRLQFLTTVGEQLVDPVFAAIAQQVTKHKAELVMAGKATPRILCLRVDDQNPNKIKEALQTPLEVSRNAPDGPATIHDLSVDGVSGTIAVVDSTGTLTIQKQFAASSKEKNAAAAASSTQKGDDDTSYSPNLQQETQLVIGGASSSQINTIGGGGAHTNKDMHITDADDINAEDTGAVVKDLIKSNPSYISDLQTLKRKEKERRGAAEAEVRREIKYKVPSYVDNEAEEGSSEEDEENDNADDDDGEQEEGGSSESEEEETAKEEARRVEEMYRRRYGLDKRAERRKQQKSGGGGAGRHGYAHDDNYGDHYDTINNNNANNYNNHNNSNFQDPYGGAPPSSSSQQHQYAAHAVRNLYSLQPGSTPFTMVEGDDGAPTLSDSRYLGFNSIGALRVAADSIFVHFHDMTKTTIKLTEKRQIVSGAMGMYAFALVLVAASLNKNSNRNGGADNDDDNAMNNNNSNEEVKHIIYYRPFKSLGLQSDWSLTLPAGEHALNIAVGNRYVAVFTTSYLRIFSPSGLELAVLSFPHHVIAASGYNSPAHAAMDPMLDPLCVAYLDGSGDAFVQVLDAADDGNVVLKPTPLALTTVNQQQEQATLRWIGWSDDGLLHTVDSVGVARRLHKQWGVQWVPVYDPVHRFTTSDRFWVWGATATHLMVYKCQGEGEQYPLANDTLPPVERLAVCIPLLRSVVGGDKAMLTREGYLREYIKLQDKKAVATVYDETMAGLDAMMDTELMKQFTQCLNDGKSSRAVDISSMFQLLSTLEEAARASNDKHERLVTEKILQLISTRKKLKKRRLSKLPFAPPVADKDKDRIMKRLLLAEKEGTLELLNHGAINAAAAAAAQSAVANPLNMMMQNLPLSSAAAAHRSNVSPQRVTNLLTSPPREQPPQQVHQQPQQDIGESPSRSTPAKRVVFEENNNNAANNSNNNNNVVDNIVGGGGGAAAESLAAPKPIASMSPFNKKPANPFTATTPNNNINNSKVAAPSAAAVSPASMPAPSPVAPPPATAAANTAAIIAGGASPAAVKKPLNPFAKPAAAAPPTTAVVPAAAPSPAKPQQQQTLLSAVSGGTSPAVKAATAPTAASAASPPKKLLRSEEAGTTPSAAAKAAPITPPSHHQQQKLTISKPNGFTAAAAINIDGPTQQPNQQHQQQQKPAAAAAPPTNLLQGPPAPAPIFNNITPLDPFASLASLQNETSIAEFAGLADIGHLGTDAPASLLAALKRDRESDDEDDDGPAIQLTL